MSLFFKKLDKLCPNQKKLKKVLNFYLNDTLYVKYYDQFKYLHNIEGKCVEKRVTKNKDIFFTVYVKTKNLYFSFFINSPLIVSILRKK